VHRLAYSSRIIRLPQFVEAEFVGTRAGFVGLIARAGTQGIQLRSEVSTIFNKVTTLRPSSSGSLICSLINHLYAPGIIISHLWKEGHLDSHVEAAINDSQCVEAEWDRILFVEFAIDDPLILLLKVV
jgi:hypothetical protein